MGASWCGEDGYFDRPQAVVEAFGRGAEVVVATVESLRPDGAGWAVELAGGETLSAGAVVVAAGADTPALLEPLGVSLPIEREERYLFYSRADPGAAARAARRLGRAALRREAAR